MSDQTVDPGLAAWLKGDALYETFVDDANAAKWADAAVATEYLSPLADRIDAAREVASQLYFLRGPLARDEHIVNGLWSGLIGTMVNLTGDRFGYQAGLDVFVIAAAESDTTDTTKLTVLCPLSRSGFDPTIMTEDGQPLTTEDGQTVELE